ncbi:unnamed protein product [marine sediment metagenome]|uniref:Dockerin domain-containing protein n=1 Tax=marine sediment metagenome TaxID=412755 RepID=X0TB94_9ZZZZ
MYAYYDEWMTYGDSGSYGVYRVFRNWSEMTCTWNSPWPAPGGDFDATADATAPKDGSGDVWYAFDVTSRVQEWIDNPLLNFGWLIKCTDELLYNQDPFHSSESTNAGLRPKLVIAGDEGDELPGDVNGDGCVNLPDVLLLAQAWGTTVDDANYDPDADVNADGSINLPDILILAAHWGESLP